MPFPIHPFVPFLFLLLFSLFLVIISLVLWNKWSSVVEEDKRDGNGETKKIMKFIQWGLDTYNNIGWEFLHVLFYQLETKGPFLLKNGSLLNGVCFTFFFCSSLVLFHFVSRSWGDRYISFILGLIIIIIILSPSRSPYCHESNYLYYY